MYSPLYVLYGTFLTYIVQFYPVLFCLFLSCLVIFCPVLSCLVLYKLQNICAICRTVQVYMLHYTSIFKWYTTIDRSKIDEMQKPDTSVDEEEDADHHMKTPPSLKFF